MTGSSPIGANSVVPMPKAPTASAVSGRLRLMGLLPAPPGTAELTNGSRIERIEREEPTNGAYNPRIIGIALVTSDLARGGAFYEQALGFDPVSSRRYDSAEVATLRLGEETLHL